MEMLEKKSWGEFRKTGLLLFVNSFLHLFGWAIVYDIANDDQINEVYPARCKFRGFDEKSMGDAYKKVTNYLKDNIDGLKEDTEL